MRLGDGKGTKTGLYLPYTAEFMQPLPDHRYAHHKVFSFPWILLAYLLVPGFASRAQV
jgi:hypothetical protein